MASKYAVRYNGVDGSMTKRFSKLADVQEYVKARWQGADYIDSTNSFHTDYARYTLSGCTLADLGHRGPAGTDDWYEWTWLDSANPSAAVNFPGQTIESVCKSGKYAVIYHHVRYDWNTDALLGESLTLHSVHSTLAEAEETAAGLASDDDNYYSVRGPEYYAPRDPKFDTIGPDEVPF